MSVANFSDQKYTKIRKQLLESKSLFQDSVFPPNLTSLGAKLAGKLQNRHIEWKRPSDLCDNPKLFKSDVLQVVPGEYSTDAMVECLQIFSAIRELCFKVIVNSGEQEWSSDSYTGLFRFRFWRFGKWTDVVIDDLLPTIDNKLIFTQCSTAGVFWMCLMEKAYAKVLGSYEAIEQNLVSDIVVDLTGGVSDVIKMNQTDEESRYDLFQTIMTDLSSHSVICASISVNEKEGDNREKGSWTPEGFICGRLYNVTAAKKVHITDLKIKNLFKGRERVAVIRLRDVTGSINSAVSSPTRSIDSATESGDEQHINSSDLTKSMSKNVAWKRLRDRDQSRFGLDREFDSELWLPFEDFYTFFSTLTIIRLYNNNIFTTGKRWCDENLIGFWTQGETGSVLDRSGSGIRPSSSFFRNPQFIIEVKQESEEVVLQLLQTSETCFPIALTVFKVEQNRKIRLHKQWGFTPNVIQLEHEPHREISFKGVIPKGRYLIVPTALEKGSSGGFLLRIISHHNCNIKELTADIPSNICRLSCITAGIIWVTVLSIKSVEGLPEVRNVFCSVKAEGEKSKTAICKDSRNVTWNDAFIFYRKKTEKPITIKVFSKNQLSKNLFLGMVEIQARVNHSPSILEVALIDSDGNALPDRILKVEILTEDDLTCV